MSNYYVKNLSADRLKLCYNLAGPRIRQYLKSEIDYSKSLINSKDIILELGCGYGRIMAELSNQANTVLGIDNSLESLLFGKTFLKDYSNCHLINSDAGNLCFIDNCFDAVLCLQNGLSAFHLDKIKLIKECLRVVKKGGLLLFSTYSKKIWDARLEWFEKQSDAGLLGKINYDKTKDGMIVCNDEFSATTIDESEFRNLLENFQIEYQLVEIDESSLFCKIIKL